MLYSMILAHASIFNGRKCSGINGWLCGCFCTLLPPANCQGSFWALTMAGGLTGNILGLATLYAK